MIMYVNLYSLFAQYTTSLEYNIHSSGTNSHDVQTSMLRPLQIMFIPIGWQKLFQAAITAAKKRCSDNLTAAIVVSDIQESIRHFFN